MAQPTGSGQEDIASKMAELLQQQAAAAQQREERLAAMIAQLLEKDARTSSDTAQATNGDTSGTTRTRPADTDGRKYSVAPGAIPVPRLCGTANLRDFATWKEKYEGYAKLTGIEKLPYEEQKAVFYTLLDDEWLRIVKFGLNNGTATGTGEGDTISKLIGEMEAHLRRQRNVILDRRDFYLRRQEPGERFDDFFMSLKEIAQFCDFCDSCTEDRFRDRILTGLGDEETIRLLLSEKDLSLQKTLDICRARENAAHDSLALMSHRTEIQTVRQAHNRHKSKESVRACSYCGGSWHESLSKCPARKAKCENCERVGHYTAVCRRGSRSGETVKTQSDGRTRRRSLSRKPDSESQKRNVQHVTIADVTRSPAALLKTPQITVGVKVADGGGTLRWTPDTGAEVSVIGEREAKSISVDVTRLTPLNEKLYAAGGGQLDSAGTFSCELYLGDRRVTTEVVVLNRFDGALLSWTECIGLGILPPDFPRQIKSTEYAASGQTRSARGARRDTTRRRSRSLTSDQKDETAVSAVSAVLPWSGGGKTLPTWVLERAPTEHERNSHAESLKEAFSSVFEDGTLRKMAGPPMRIQLKEDAKPVATTAARAIPYAWRDDIKNQLDDLARQGIIVPVSEPTEWCHPMTPVFKTTSDGTQKVRLCVDLTRLNEHVRRPAYPMKTPHDVVSAIGTGAKYFTKLDAKSGYFQIPLHEDDQHLTCFITPWGRYMFTRAVMGLSSSGDEYNQRGDQALAGLQNTCKIVDDILIYSEDYSSHLKQVQDVLRRCEEHGITLNVDKMAFAQAVVEYCGYTVGEHGFKPDEKKIRAIAEFPAPATLTDLRSFLGLVNQLGEFSADIARAAAPLRDLLKPSNVWTWTEVHQNAFNDVKKALTSPPILAFFDPALPTVLQTDASRLHGLGFALMQKHGDRWRLVQCGSRFLTDTESRYSVIELEMLALVWSVRKCRTYLAGLTFEAVLDHRPLIPILNNKMLADIENPRLQRLRQSLMAYRFTASWRSGSKHCVPDALSRAPVDEPSTDDAEAEKDLNSYVRAVVVGAAARVTDEHGPTQSQERSPDLMLTRIRDAGSLDDEYVSLRTAVEEGFPSEKTNLPIGLRPYWPYRGQLSVDGDVLLMGARLVIPASLRRDVLAELHASHQGIDKTKRRGRQSVFWPGLNNDIENTVRTCRPCRENLPSQRKEPLMDDPAPKRVFESVSADFFTAAGKPFLVYVDRLSGWPVIATFARDATARDLVTTLRKIFASTGVPNVLRSDGGPQFSAKITRDFMKRWQIDHRMSTPYYPQSNGHAEAAVKSAKRLILKTTQNGNTDSDEFAKGLLELRNTPRADGRSPAQVLFGHPLRSAVPAHYRAFAPEWQKSAAECDEKAQQLRSATRERYDASAGSLGALKTGNYVDVQDPISCLWTRTGIVVAVGRRRDYLVKLPSGRIMWRNRRFLRLHHPHVPVQRPEGPGVVDDSPNVAHGPRVRFADEASVRLPAPSRRSNRTMRPPERLQVDPRRRTYRRDRST